jgi:predicted amidophosphoribosyltransferase
MANMYCDTCSVRFDSSVATCPHCGTAARRVHAPLAALRASAPRRAAFMRASAPRRAAPREDVELEVRDALYGWHSGTVERLTAR